MSKHTHIFKFLRKTENVFRVYYLYKCIGCPDVMSYTVTQPLRSA